MGCLKGEALVKAKAGILLTPGRGDSICIKLGSGESSILLLIFKDNKLSSNFSSIEGLGGLGIIFITGEVIEGVFVVTGK